MNILIIGVGNIGKSHLNGLIKSSIKKKINLYDVKKIKINEKNVTILEKFPKNKKFFLAIMSTNVKERFSLTKKLFQRNKVENLLLEKYIFKNINEFNFFEKNILKKVNKCFVNCWGKILLKIFNIKPTNKKIEVKVEINNDAFLSNFIHFLEIFYYLTSKQNKKYQISNTLKKIINSKRRGYKELNGKFFVKNETGSLLLYESKKLNNVFKMTIKKGKKSKKIILNNNFELNFFYNKKVLSKKFPLSSYTTKILLENLLKKNTNKFILPDFINIAPLNKIILRNLHDKLKGKNFT